MRVLMLVTNDEAPFFRQQVATLEEAGVDIHTVTVPDREGPQRARRDYLRFYWSVLQAVSDHYDLVHANYGLTAPAALAQPRRPVVLSLWGSDLFGRYGWLSRRCAARADRVIVMSRQMERELDTDAQVIPHGIDLEKFQPQPREAARDAVGWSADGVDVLFPYDPDREVKDYARAQRIFDEAAATLDRPARLRVVHGVDHDTMPSYMNAADAMLLTSKTEGSPNAVREALACNLPVVATDVGDVGEYVGPLTYSGVSDDDGELVERLVGVLRDAPVAEGRTQVEDIGIDTMRDQLLNVYDSVTRPRMEVPANG